MFLFEITREPIDVGKAIAEFIPEDCGATVSLCGYARRFTEGKETESLFYEAYEPMAVAEMRRLGEQAIQLFPIKSVVMIHRIGTIEIGETSVVAAVAAPHRKAAFAACEWLINELKRTVPIWKKEIYKDGESWI